MHYFSTRQVFFLCSYTIDEKEQEKIDKFLKLLDDSGVAEVLNNTKPKEKPAGGRPEINRYHLFATILYGFALDSETLRDLERACKYDLRYIYLMNGEQPTHVVFGNFINEYIVPNSEEVFSRVTKQIIKECGIVLDDVYLDGTKIEANANKYKFVWKPTTFHNRLSDKIRNVLEKTNLSRGIPGKGIIPSKQIAEKLSELSKMKVEAAEDNRKTLKACYDQLNEYLEKSLEYEEKERICGPNRNSYYKTDYDATAMALKEDYYSGLGSNMHAAYNAQVAVCKGIACAYYVSQSRTDISEMIPTIDQYYRIFGVYPENLCADAGYGSLENYRYLHEHNIGNFVKHQSWNGNINGTNPIQYRLNDDETITCLNDKIGRITEVESRHPKKAGNVFFKVVGCKKCSFRVFCKRWQQRKSENFKIFEVNIEFCRYRQQAEDNLLSVKGIEVRVNRSCQVEGSFGVLKQDMQYIRFRRTTLPKVTAEYMLTFLGYNIRKLFRYYSGNLKADYWKAPYDLKPETFKKPSAVKLSKKESGRNKKSVNQKAKLGYRYKKRAV